MTFWSPRHRTADPAAAPAEPDSQAGTIYAIGDIHGCYALMTDLLARIVADAEALPAAETVTLVFLGDYIDRGPDSAAVLSALIWIARNAPYETVFLRGNHEQAMLDYLEDPRRADTWLEFGGAQTLAAYGVAVPADYGPGADHPALRDALLDRLPASHLAFLRGLPLSWESADHLFVHAGIRPGTAIAAQDPRDLLWIRTSFLDDDRPHGKVVVHGHSWSSGAPVQKANRIGVDTGAYATGLLTAARLRAGTVAFLQAGTAG